MDGLKILSVVVIALGLFGCAGSPNVTEVGNQTPVELSQLNANSFILHVDKIVEGTNINVPEPNVIIPDINYAQSNSSVKYPIAFVEERRRVVIGTDKIIGELETEKENIIQYHLSDGLFAGGRFLVWIENEQFHAEFTQYGSGIPIIKSERGILFSSETTTDK